MKHNVVEIRTYKFKPGMGKDFFALLEGGAGEMLKRHGISVIGYGMSSHDPDTGFLMRGFATLEKREEQLNGFYGSEEWNTKYNTKAMSTLDTYNTLVLTADDPAFKALLGAL